MRCAAGQIMWSGPLRLSDLLDRVLLLVLAVTCGSNWAQWYVQHSDVYNFFVFYYPFQNKNKNKNMPDIDVGDIKHPLALSTLDLTGGDKVLMEKEWAVKGTHGLAYAGVGVC